MKLFFIIFFSIIHQIFSQSTGVWDFPSAPPTTPTELDKDGDMATCENLVKIYDSSATSTSMSTYYETWDTDHDEYNQDSTLTTTIPNIQSVDCGASLSTLSIVAAGIPNAGGEGFVTISKDMRSTWTEMMILQASDGATNDLFGYDVTLDEFNPRKLLVGAPGDGTTGSAYLFQSSPTAKYWTQYQKLLPSGGSTSFGTSVELMGKSAAITSPNTCQVYTYAQQLDAPPGCPGSERRQRQLLESSLSENHDAHLRGGLDVHKSVSSRKDSFESSKNRHYGVYDEPIMQPELPQWTQMQVLLPSGACDGDLQISLYENTLVIGVQHWNGYDDDLLQPIDDVGEVYVYTSTEFEYDCSQGINFRQLSTEEKIDGLHDNPISPTLEAERNLVDCSKRCHGVHWSIQQTIQNPAGEIECSRFGSKVDVYEDVMVIQAANKYLLGQSGLDNCDPLGDHQDVGGVYIYRRSGDTWTLDTVIDGTQSPAAGDTLNYGMDVDVTGNAVYVKYLDNGASTYYIDQIVSDSSWKCLLIEMGDQFGDGWNGADLVISSPDGKKERYTLQCQDIQTINPLTFRWCPDEPCDTDSQVGHDNHYTIEIPDGLNIPFHWEIYYKVTEEATGESIIGTAGSKLSYIWNCEDLSMQLKSATLVHDTTASCERCPNTPTLKPTPALPPPKPQPEDPDGPGHDHDHDHDHEHDGDPGHDHELGHQDNQRLLNSVPSPSRSPTVSPRPTVAHEVGYEKWPYITITSNDGSAWWSANKLGTEYYISTDDGKHLLNHGSLCSSDTSPVSVDCWLNIPEKQGDFILRVGGAMAPSMQRAQESWTFCNRDSEPVKTQLNFRGNPLLSGDHCDPLYEYTSDDTYCENFIEKDIQVVGTMTPLGLPNDALSFFTSEDYNLLALTFSKLFYVSHTLEAQVSRGMITNTLYFNIYVSPMAVGLSTDFTDPTTLVNTYMTASSILQDAFQSNKFTNSLKEIVTSSTETSYLKTYFTSSSSASSSSPLSFQLTDVHAGYDIHFFYADDDVNNGEETSSNSNHSSNSSESEWTMSHTLLVIGLVGVAMLVIRTIKRASHDLDENGEEDGSGIISGCIEDQEAVHVDNSRSSVDLDRSSDQLIRGKEDDNSDSDEDPQVHHPPRGRGMRKQQHQTQQNSLPSKKSTNSTKKTVNNKKSIQIK